MPDSAVVELVSPLDFAATLKRLTDAIAAACMTVYATLDHAGAAKQAGLAMPPTVVLIYGNAKVGTPLMLASPIAALDLPMRVLIREDGAGTYVSFHPIAQVLRTACVPETMSSRLDRGQQILVDALS